MYVLFAQIKHCWSRVHKLLVLEYVLAFFKVINIRLIFMNVQDNFFGCHESTIDERFMRLIDHAKLK